MKIESFLRFKRHRYWSKSRKLRLRKALKGVVAEAEREMKSNHVSRVFLKAGSRWMLGRSVGGKGA